MGAERGVNCELMSALLTNVLQQHWNGRKIVRTTGCRGSSGGSAFVACLDVKTAFDVAKPSVVAKKLTLTGTRARGGSLCWLR